MATGMDVVAGKRGGRVDSSALPGMVQWYSPAFLIVETSRAVLARLAGDIASEHTSDSTIDGASAEVLLGIIHQYDRRAEPNGEAATWFDYVGNAGEGFNSTYAVAYLMSLPQIEVGGHCLPRPELLVLGGSQVAPYPSRHAYRQRFVLPYAAALPGEKHDPPRRELFALPGDRDRMDGLNAFDYTFCRARFDQPLPNRIGGWICPQRRGYFAIRLPHDWWIWGIDARPDRALDLGQTLYFRAIAEEMRTSGEAKVILCMSYREWSGGDAGEDATSLESVVQTAQAAGARVCAVLAGDLHNYCRYESDDGVPFVVSGGGGSHLRATHSIARELKPGQTLGVLQLQPRSETGFTKPEAACWPSRSTSRWLSLRVLSFPLRNYGFCVGLGVIYWLALWLFATTQHNGTPVGEFILLDPNFRTSDILLLAPLVVATNVGLGFLMLAMWLALYAYADGSHGNKVRVLLGTAHFSAHLAAMLLLYFVSSAVSMYLVDVLWPQTVGVLQTLDLATSSSVRELFRSIVVAPLLLIFVGAFVGGLVWGAYLAISAQFNLHVREAFAAVGDANFKNFLRIKVERDKLTIFPIGLRKVPRKWRSNIDAGGAPRFLPMKPVETQLIDGPIEKSCGSSRQVR